MKKILLAASLGLLSITAGAVDGAYLWKARCQDCHGADGRAQTLMGRKESMADFTNPVWQRQIDDRMIYAIIAEGSPRNAKMKAFKDKLTPEQIGLLVRHIRSLR